MKSADLQFHLEEIPLISFTTPVLTHSCFTSYFSVFHFNYKHIETELLLKDRGRDRKYSLQSSFFHQDLVSGSFSSPTIRFFSSPMSISYCLKDDIDLSVFCLFFLQCRTLYAILCLHLGGFFIHFILGISKDDVISIN